MPRFAWLTLAIGLTACADEQPLEPRFGADSAPLPVLTSVATSSVTLASLGTPTGWTDSFAEGVNSSGLGVGWASGGSPSFVAVVFGAPVEVIPPLISLQAPPIQAHSINDAQLVTGQEAFVYSVGSAAATRLPTLAGDYTGLAEVGYDISNAGDVVGFSRLASSPQFPRAVLWRGASAYTPIDLGVPAGAPALLPSEARSIAPNLFGANTIVVGYTEQCATVTLGCTDSWGPRHAFIWRNGTMSLLPSVPGPGGDHDWSEAYGVADNGMVVGMSLDKGAILWDGGQVIELGLPCGALFSGGYGVSVARAIALTSSTPSRVLIVGDCRGQPTVWFDNGPCGYQAELLPLLPGDTDGAARDVNASGQIVGYTRASATGGAGHAVRWAFTPPPLSSTCPSLELSKQAAQANVLAGTRIVFTLSVTNTGPGTAQAAVLSDVLPTGPGLSWLIDTQGPGTPCAISAGTVTCALGDLASGASFSVSVGTETSTSSCGRHDNTASATAANRSPAEASTSVTVECVSVVSSFLILDEDAIDNGLRYWESNLEERFFSETDVNDDIARLAQRRQLRYFASNVGRTINLVSGQVGDEGWFAPKVVPSSWLNAGPTADGLRNFLGNPSQPYAHNVGPGLGTGRSPQKHLDNIPFVTPLRAEGLWMLIGQTVCAVVYDGDISINYDPQNGSLKGKTVGVVAFEVRDAQYLAGFSSRTLPRVTVTIRDANMVCEGLQALLNNAPEPSSSSEPMDIRPNNGADNDG